MTASIRGCDIPFLSMHIQTQPFNGPLFGTTQVGQYQKKTFTHSQLSWSSNILYLLWSIASSLFNLRCLRVLFHCLSPGPLWSTSWSGTLYWILHEFRHPIIINFFAIHAHTTAACFAVVPSYVIRRQLLDNERMRSSGWFCLVLQMLYFTR